MLTKNVERATFATFKFLTLIKVLPFDFHHGKKLFSVPTSFGPRWWFQIVQNILLIISPIHAVYILYTLVQSEEGGLLTIGQQLVHIGSTLSSTLYLIDITKHREEYASLFNRVITLNKKYGGSSSSPNLDNMGSGWRDPLNLNEFLIFLPLFYATYTAAVIALVTSFEVKQKNHFTIYGHFPPHYQTVVTFTIFMVIDLFITITRNAMWIFMVYFQGYCMTSFGYWLKRISADTTTNFNDLNERIHLHRCQQLLVRHFNLTCEWAMIVYKTSCTFCGIGCLFVLIRFHGQLDWTSIGFLSPLGAACVGIPPRTYGNAFKIHFTSGKFRREGILGINFLRLTLTKKLCRLRLHSLAPVSVKVGNYFFIDSTFTPRYLSHTFEDTITCLLTL